MQLRDYALGVVSYSCADQAHCPLTIAWCRPLQLGATARALHAAACLASLKTRTWAGLLTTEGAHWSRLVH